VADRKEQPPTGAEWHALLDEERRAREAARNGDVAVLRKWWGLIEGILQQLAQPDGREPPPRELLLVLSKLAGYLAVGQVPDPVAGVAGRGEKQPGPSERHHIRMAVTYRYAAKVGMIEDKSPVKTIVEAYGLGDRTTLQKWCRLHEPYDLAEYARLPHVITSRMRESGARYKIAGRSQGAISGRGHQ